MRRMMRRRALPVVRKSSCPACKVKYASGGELIACSVCGWCSHGFRRSWTGIVKGTCSICGRDGNSYAVGEAGRKKIIAFFAGAHGFPVDEGQPPPVVAEPDAAASVSEPTALADKETP